MIVEDVEHAGFRYPRFAAYMVTVFTCGYHGIHAFIANNLKCCREIHEGDPQCATEEGDE